VILFHFYDLCVRRIKDAGFVNPTTISYRPELTVKKILFRAESAELENVQLALLKD